MLTMYKQITIKTLKKQGFQNTKIARQLDCHRNTVANVLSRDNLLERQSREKPSYFDAYKEEIKELLSQKLTRLRTFEVLKDKYGLTRTYDALCKYIQKILGRRKEAFVVQSTLPGEEAEADFGYVGLFKDEGGILRKVWCFEMTLSYCRQSFYTLVFNQKATSLIKACEKGFAFFGGVPRRLKLDNLKSAILRNRRYDLEFNQDFLEFSCHYGFVIVPCTPAEPQQKGKVEKGIGYLKINFLPGRTFKDKADLEIQLRDWVARANQRKHGTTKKVPQEVFEKEEKAALLPLPETAFICHCPARRLVKPNCHINFQNVYYSVPCCLVGEEVEARLAGNLLRIFFQNEEVATHVFSSSPGTYVTNPSHFPPTKVYSFTTYQAKYEKEMEEIGEKAHHFFKTILEADPKAWSRTTRKILGLVSLHGKERVEKALARALLFNALSPEIVKNILEKGLEEEEVEPVLIRQEGQEEENQEDLDRDLNYYFLETKDTLEAANEPNTLSA